MFTRALIVLLLVLNLGVAAWWLLRAEPPAPALPAQPAGVPRLRLVSEAGAGTRIVQGGQPQGSDRPVTAPASPAVAAPAEDAPAPAPAPVAARCYSFGPFADQASAAAARARLPAGLQGARLRSEPPRRGSWTVLMPPQADAAAARALAQRIDAAGFKDYYVIAEGASANGVALGRFGSEESAGRHQAALQAAGFQAQVQAPAGGGTWLDVDAVSSFDAEATRSALAAPGVQTRACAAGAPSGLR